MRGAFLSQAVCFLAFFTLNNYTYGFNLFQRQKRAMGAKLGWQRKTYFTDGWWPPSDQLEEEVDPMSCYHRPSHWSFEGKKYADMSLLPRFKRADGKPQTFTWLEAKNLCRRYCMGLISFQTERKWEMFKRIYANESRYFVWTSGRICDFEGCERLKYLQPAVINGWLWSEDVDRMTLSPTNATPPGWSKQPWSSGGYGKRPQPDQLERDGNNNPEQAIAAIKNNIFGREPGWHDMLCAYRGLVVCEDHWRPLEAVQSKYPNLAILT